MSQWKGLSPEEREGERRRRLLDASLALVDAEGLAALTVRGVCTRAGLTSRYFYESFAGTAELLTALYDDVAERALADALATLSIAAVLDADLDTDGAGHGGGGDNRTVVRAAITASVDGMAANAAPIRFLLSHATADPALNARRRAFIATASRQLAAGVRAGGGGGRDGRPSAQAVLRARFALGGMLELATAFVEGEITRRAFVDALTDQLTDLKPG